MSQPEPPVTPPDPERDRSRMFREAQEVLRYGKHWVRKSQDLMRKAVLLHWAYTLLLTFGVSLGVLNLSWRIKDDLFGRTATFRFRGSHAPQYTRAEYETEFVKRVTEAGYTVDRLKITGQNSHNQFNGEITLIRVPSSTSDYDVLNHLRSVSESMKDKVLSVEPVR